ASQVPRTHGWGLWHRACVSPSARRSTMKAVLGFAFLMSLVGSATASQRVKGGVIDLAEARAVIADFVNPNRPQMLGSWRPHHFKVRGKGASRSWSGENPASPGLIERGRINMRQGIPDIRRVSMSTHFPTAW